MYGIFELSERVPQAMALTILTGQVALTIRPQQSHLLRFLPSGRTWRDIVSWSIVPSVVIAAQSYALPGRESRPVIYVVYFQVDIGDDGLLVPV